MNHSNQRNASHRSFNNDAPSENSNDQTSDQRIYRNQHLNTQSTHRSKQHCLGCTNFPKNLRSTVGQNSDSLRAVRSGERIPVVGELSWPFQTGPGAHPFYIKMGTGSPGGKGGRDMALTIHTHPAPRLKKEYSYTSTPFFAFVDCKVKVPLQAWTGPEGSRKLRFPDFVITAQDGGKVVSLVHRPPLPTGNTPGTHFC